MWAELLIISQICQDFGMQRGNLFLILIQREKGKKNVAFISISVHELRDTEFPPKLQLQPAEYSRLGCHPIGFGPAHLMKALCKWVHLMIRLNMIKKNEATHIHMLTHTHTHSVLFRDFHIAYFSVNSCGDLY